MRGGRLLALHMVCSCRRVETPTWGVKEFVVKEVNGCDSHDPGRHDTLII